MKFLAISSLLAIGFLTSGTQAHMISNQNNQNNCNSNGLGQNNIAKRSGLGSSKSNLKNEKDDKCDKKLSNVGKSYCDGDNKIRQKTKNKYDSKNCKYDETNDYLVDLKSLVRSYDGTGNNLKNPLWGAKNTNFRRLCSPNYQNGLSQMWQQIPNARIVSNSVGALTGNIQYSKAGINLLFVEFGQFLDHDFASAVGSEVQVQNIQIPLCDKFFDKTCKGTQFLGFTRSAFDKTKKVRTNINQVTHWIDGSQLYGNDKKTADSLRQFKKGKLIVTSDNMLPKDLNGFYISADPEINQNPALIVFQTIFRREHNRVCDAILSIKSNLCDQEVYQAAKNFVTGLYQHIAYDEFLPLLLGKQNYNKYIGEYKYQSYTQPTLYTDFATASYRIGHTLVNAPFKLIDANGKETKVLTAGQMFFNPSLVNAQTVDQFINGLIQTYGKQRSLQLVGDLRNFLFDSPSRQQKIDLFSFNVQRGRDHGVCTLNDAREKVGLSKKEKFTQLFADSYKADILGKLYQQTNKMDLWLGILGEPSEPGSIMGELGIRMNALQFRNTRNADRLWYENIFPKQIIKEIKATTFSDIIERNTGVKKLSQNVFKVNDSKQQCKN